MSKKSILVVEDERIIADDISRSLAELGYSVCGTASSGEEAIKKASELAPDLVLMDIILKGQIDGVRAAAHIRNTFNIPVVYLTSHSDEATLNRARETGPFGYLLKPFDERELRTTIEMAIYGHRMEKVLKESERWLSITLRSIADGVVVTDGEWGVEFLNPAAEALTGWALEDALGRELGEVFILVGDNECRASRSVCERAYREGVIVSADRDVRLLNKDGHEVPIELKAAPTKGEQGAISGLVLTFHDVTERRRAEEDRRKLIEELEYLSRTDRLTGIYNRGALIDRLDYEIHRSVRYGSDLSLILCDIDNFKDINDTYGHLAGDAALKAVGKVLRQEVRDSDVVGRYGGDEFMVILPETGIDEAAETAERVRRSVMGREIRVSPEANLLLTLSLGVSAFLRDEDNVDAFIKRADDGLYASKREGRNRASVVRPD